MKAPNLRVLLATSEVHPFSKTGGLADMVAALAKSLARRGHEVALVTPLYRGIAERYPAIERFPWEIDVPMGWERRRGAVRRWVSPEGVRYYFIDQPGYFDRDGLYQWQGGDYGDNAERFIFFSKCAAHLSRYLPWHCDIVHVHDWQSALVPLLVRRQAQWDGWENPPATCLTIHNLAYQGVFDAHDFARTNLPWSEFNSGSVEFYGRMNCLKTGIVHADAVTTVSPRYAQEILTTEYGCGLEGVLALRRQGLTGILNGVDTDEWNPAGDPHLVRPFEAGDWEGKRENTRAVRAEIGLPDRPDLPLFANIGRLVDQKGCDLVVKALGEILEEPDGLQFVQLGSGEAGLERALLDLQRRHPDRVAVRVGYDHRLSHRIEAGADFFLMPSRFEPCGLNQMYSLLYGAVPVVRATGGLDDTVVDARDDVTRANGVKFREATPEALEHAVRQAIAIFRAPRALEFHRWNGMTAELGWERTALAYESVYRSLLVG